MTSYPADGGILELVLSDPDPMETVFRMEELEVPYEYIEYYLSACERNIQNWWEPERFAEDNGLDPEEVTTALIQDGWCVGETVSALARGG